MRSNQSVFNTVVARQIAQGEPALDMEYGTQCKYLTTYGKQCAAGCLIPLVLIDSEDKDLFLESEEDISCILLGDGPEYDPEYDPDTKMRRYFNKVGISKDNASLIRALQKIHDGDTTKDWLNQCKNRWVALASKFDLELPTVLKEWKERKVI